jgi:hypothetical protein
MFGNSAAVFAAFLSWAKETDRQNIKSNMVAAGSFIVKAHAVLKRNELGGGPSLHVWYTMDAIVTVNSSQRFSERAGSLSLGNEGEFSK